MNKILGLDISSASTGICVITDGYIQVSTLDTINPTSKDCLGKKLVFFEKELRKILKKYNPENVVAEDIYRGINAKTFRTLAMFRGVAFKVIYEKLGKDPVCVMPTEARKIVNVGGVTKEDSFRYIKDKLCLTDYEFETHNDQTDAAVLALAGYKICYEGYVTAAKLKKPKKRKKK